MQKFSWYDAKTLEDALKRVNATVSGEIVNKSGDAAVIKAGGIDLLDMMKEGLLAPSSIVSIRNIPGLDRIITERGGGLRLGANVTLAEIEEHAEIKKNYYALHQAVAKAATPQIRNAATLGGNLAQRTRCWYFRSNEHACLRKGGSTCFARNGENENHAILNNGSCVSVHASSVSTALMAFEAMVEIRKSNGEMREVAMEEFFVSPGEDATVECILGPDEIITAVVLPPLGSGVKSYYIKQGARESYDWSIADVAVVMEMSGSRCREARIVLGAAAPTPLRARTSERTLQGQNITKEVAERAAQAAMQRARPLAQNGYKVPLFTAILKQAILEIA